MAIASGCSRAVNTDCFSQALNRIWFNKLAHLTLTPFNVVKMAASLLTFGLLAPWLIAYRLAEETDEVYYQKEYPYDPKGVMLLPIRVFLESFLFDLFALI